MSVFKKKLFIRSSVLSFFLLLVSCSSSTSKVGTPVIDTASGVITDGTQISITCATTDATIHFTQDGTDPTESSSLYSGPITINAAMTIKAKAFKSGFEASDAASATYTVAKQSIFVGGGFEQYASTYVGFLIKLSYDDATTDTSFDTKELDLKGAGSPVRVIIFQPDGKMLVAGHFIAYDNIAVGRLARVNTDGTLDTTLDTTTGANGAIYSAALQSDGKIIIGGDFTTYNGVTANHLARINTTGSLDTAFNTTVGANLHVNTVAIQSDGKIIIGGDFTTYNSTPVGHIARIKSEDGTLDTTFDTTSLGGTNDVVNIVAVQTDNKIIVGGVFTKYNGTDANRLARVNTVGALDITFDTATNGGANDAISAIAIQANGKILIGGYFNAYNGTSVGHLTRICIDNTSTGCTGVGGGVGSLDTSFDTTTLGGADSYVNVITTQNEGKILIGGEFTHYKGTSVGYLARVNSNGTLDTAFVTGPPLFGGPNSSVYAITAR